MSQVAAAHVVRAPQQERSKLAWKRALDVGCELLESGGVDAVTVTEVCRLSRMSPPSLYARVDGRPGLIAAVFEHAMARVRRFEDDQLASVDPARFGTEERIRRVALAMSEIFRQQRSVLRPIIAASAVDAGIHARGIEEARRVREVLVALLGLPPDVGHDIAAMIFAELVVRTVYGGEFTASSPEDDEAFVARLTRMGCARVGTAG